MALSRLRNSIISRAPLLLRARYLSSARVRGVNSCRYCSGKNYVASGDGEILRPVSLCMITGTHAGYKQKLQVGARYFSSADAPPHTVLGMPALSPTMSQGNIAKWRKKEGDKIEVGDILCEIETDKATLEFECLEEGFLAQILVAEGSKDVPVGQPIAIMVEEAEDIQKVPVSVAGGSEEKVEKVSTQDSKIQVQETSSTKINAENLPPHLVLEMPALSPTMNQGNIVKWRKKEGEKIEVGDVICEIETDKATLEFESLEEGYLAKILAPEGSKEVSVGQPIAVTVEDPSDIEAVKNSISSGTAKEEHTVAEKTRSDVNDRKYTISRISPSAKVLISEHGLEPTSLKASGARGTLLKADVLAAIKSGSLRLSKDKKQTTVVSSSATTTETRASLKESTSFEDIPNSQIRKFGLLQLYGLKILGLSSSAEDQASIIAKRLLESKQITPHLYLSTDVTLDPLLSFRKELKDKHDIKVSVNDIVIKAVAMALSNVPGANAFWDVEKGEIIPCNSVDISIAVATEKGLMTPIIRNADQKTISAISIEVKELAEKARAGKLKPNEFQGGTFSISNLGMYPVDQFCAIINPPQAGILAIGRGNQVVQPVTGADGVERPAVINKMSLTLSADHRVLDGAIGGAFLSALRMNFSDIRRLML